MGLAISQQHNFVFIHVPKTAGHTIWSFMCWYGYNDLLPPERAERAGLGRFWDARLRTSNMLCRASEAGHWRYVDLVQILGQNWLDQQRIYAVVRNPWDKAVSAYLYDVKTKPHVLAPEATFTDWLQYAERTWQEDLDLLLLYSQHTYLVDTNGGLPRNLYLLRFETLTDDFKRMCAEVNFVVPPGLPPLDLTGIYSHQAVGRKPYREYYTPETRARIELLFHRDVAMFGYTF